MSESNNRVTEILLEEFRLLRQDIKEDGLRRDEAEALLRKDVSTLKNRFMLVAVTMGLAGGKLSALLPFLK